MCVELICVNSFAASVAEHEATGRAVDTPRCFTFRPERDYQIATGLPFAPVAPRIGDGAKKYANS
jgi:hypothetical protein